MRFSGAGKRPQRYFGQFVVSFVITDSASIICVAQPAGEAISSSVMRFDFADGSSCAVGSVQ